MTSILIVDDEADFIELVKFRLASLPCEFLTANDGVHALSQARQCKPDLILLDIELPDMNGFDAEQLVKRLDHHLAGIVHWSAPALGTTRWPN